MAQESFLEGAFCDNNEKKQAAAKSIGNENDLDKESTEYANCRLKNQVKQDLSCFMQYKSKLNKQENSNEEEGKQDDSNVFEIIKIVEKERRVNDIVCPQITIILKAKSNGNKDEMNKSIHGSAYPIELEITYQYDDDIMIPSISSHDNHGHTHSHTHSHGHNHNEQNEKKMDIDKSGSSNSNGSNSNENDKIDFSEEIIHIRPRINSIINHIAIGDCGIIKSYVFESSNLKWDNIIDIFESIIMLLTKPSMILDEIIIPKMYPIDRLKHIWSVHDESDNNINKNQVCKCQLYYCMPCDYQTFLKKSKQSTENETNLIKQFRNNLSNMINESYIEEQKTINKAITNYNPIFPQLFIPKIEFINWENFLDSQFLKFWKQIDFDNNYYNNNNNKEMLTKNHETFIKTLCKMEIEDKAYSFPLFNNKFCDMLYKELSNYQLSKNVPQLRPNSMNNYGVILNYIGLKPLIDLLFEKYLNKIAILLFGMSQCHKYFKNDTFYHTLDSHHTFMVEYEMGNDLSLDMHIDDSEMTFNINLFDQFEGADLAICGYHSNVGENMSNDPDSAEKIRKHLINYKHGKGRCLIHSGKQRHGALPITSGKRCNLIVWCRSSYKREIIGGRDRVIEKYQNETSDKHGKNENIIIPDIVCLSKTHDRDYNYWIQEMTKMKLYSNDVSNENIVNDVNHESIAAADENNPLLN